MGCSPSGSLVHGILQARVLEWVAISSPGDLPDPGMEPGSPALQADSSCWATREEEGAGVSFVCFGGWGGGCLVPLGVGRPAAPDTRRPSGPVSATELPQLPPWVPPPTSRWDGDTRDASGSCGATL